MDSKDKMLADLRDNVRKQSVVIAQKAGEVEALTKQVLSLQSESAGVNAVRNSLQNEQALTVQLNGQIETLKTQVKSLTDENASLKEMNLRLQAYDQNKEG